MKGATKVIKQRKTTTVIALLAAAVMMLLSSTLTLTNSLHAYAQEQEVKTLRIGYFPNINHAQAVIGLGKGDFQNALGNNVKVESFQFNAGPISY
jgi:sulfonate transport system substrate-binding protein